MVAKAAMVESVAFILNVEQGLTAEQRKFGLEKIIWFLVDIDEIANVSVCS